MAPMAPKQCHGSISPYNQRTIYTNYSLQMISNIQSETQKKTTGKDCAIRNHIRLKQFIAILAYDVNNTTT
jgi:hypothetical protein